MWNSECDAHDVGDWRSIVPRDRILPGGCWRRVPKLDIRCPPLHANTNIAKSHVFAVSPQVAPIHFIVARPYRFTMTEETPSASIRSSQGSHRRTPKNVSMPSAFHSTTASLCVYPRLQLTAPVMQPQQQLSQIEKSVTHLLVATKQLLGPSNAPKTRLACANTAKKR
jgi:hypothetical protein